MLTGTSQLCQAVDNKEMDRDHSCEHARDSQPNLYQAESRSLGKLSLGLSRASTITLLPEIYMPLPYHPACKCSKWLLELIQQWAHGRQKAAPAGGTLLVLTQWDRSSVSFLLAAEQWARP